MGDWIQTLTESIDEYWKENTGALPLAQVPALLRRHGILVADILEGRKLRDTLSEESGGRFQIVQHPSDPLVWGLVPSSASVDPEGGSFWPSKGHIVKTAKFDRAVWTAFVVRLAENHRRFLWLQPTPQFLDTAEKGDDLVGAYEINQNDIYSPTVPPQITEARQAEIERRIYAWLERHGIDRSLVLVRRSNTSIPPQAVKRKLDISHLSQSDLARIVIPLDVVLKIIFE